MAEIKRKVLIPVDGSPNSQKAFDCKFLQQKFCFKRLFFQNLMGQTTNNDRHSIEQSVDQGQSIEFFDYRINRIQSNAIERLKFDQSNQSNDNRINQNLKNFGKFDYIRLPFDSVRLAFDYIRLIFDCIRLSIAGVCFAI